MTFTNTIYLLSVVLTNWQNIPGDFRREGGTNYLRQQQVVSTNLYVVEVVLCTNRTLYRHTEATNGPVRWEPVSIGTMPALPGVLEKP